MQTNILGTILTAISIFEVCQCGNTTDYKSTYIEVIAITKHTPEIKFEAQKEKGTPSKLIGTLSNMFYMVQLKVAVKICEEHILF